MAELKPCPFCGGRQHVENHGRFGRWCVKHTCKGGSGNGNRMHINASDFAVEEDAVNAWNKRMQKEEKMKNFVVLDGVVYDLVRREEPEEQGNGGVAERPVRTLGEVPVGDIVRIGDLELIVLEQREGRTVLICKELFRAKVEFGESNNYKGSNADRICNEFAEEIIGLAGAENVLLFEVDLTADDGLKDYGVIQRKASLLTAEQYRRYVETLDKHKLDAWWWLATPFSTPAHEDDEWVKCVSPAGGINDGYYDSYGVRPFCILKSNIFVSN